MLKIEGKAEIASNLLFSFELEFGGVFRIRNVPQESLNAVVLIECPRLLFPFAREIIATTVRNGGFPPLLLDPVDFVALYRQKMAQMPAGQQAPRSRVFSAPWTGPAAGGPKRPVFGGRPRPNVPHRSLAGYRSGDSCRLIVGALVRSGKIMTSRTLQSRHPDPGHDGK